MSVAGEDWGSAGLQSLESEYHGFVYPAFIKLASRSRGCCRSSAAMISDLAELYQVKAIVRLAFTSNGLYIVFIACLLA
jgi:hypothetical protein